MNQTLFARYCLQRRETTIAARIRTSRRGSIGLAMVIVLVILQLVIVGVVVGGARDQDLAVKRLDFTQASYAAEAGANMAIRELMNDADEDGDGGIGSISDDGNPSNDPVLGSAARVWVSESVSGAETTLTVRGRAGAASSHASVVAEYGTVGGGTTLTVFSRSGTSVPRYSVWNGSIWGPSTAMPDIGGEGNHVVLRNCPIRNELGCLFQDSNQDINGLIFNGSSWIGPYEVCSSTGETTNRAFDLAYEQNSGDALIVYWRAASGQVGYRTWNGSTLSSEGLLSLSGATDANTLALYARPSSDTVILLAQNLSAGAFRLSASVWNGSSWSGWTHLNTDVESDTTECFSLAYESLSTHALVVYAADGSSNPRYRTWNGSSWSAESSAPSVGGQPQWIKLAADPLSDTILFGALDDQEDVNINRWGGTAWGTHQQLEKKAGAPDRRRFDIAFENGGTRALIAYTDKDGDRLRTRNWDGSTWSGEGPWISLGGPKPHGVVATTGPSSGQVMLAVKDDAKDIHLMRWDGASITGKIIIETNYGGPDESEQVMIGAAPDASSPRMVSWYYVAPQ